MRHETARQREIAQPDTAQRFRVPGILLLLAAATALAFRQAWSYGFVAWDDNILVYENPYLNPVTAAKTWELWRQSHEMLYMPMTYTAWAILALLGPATPAQPGDFSLNPHVFHAANLVLHILNVLLVFAILRLLLRRSEVAPNEGTHSTAVYDWAAAGGALLFAFHPLQVESVVWISELKGVLCGFFSLLALWQYLHYATLRQHEDAGSSGGKPPMELAAHLPMPNSLATRRRSQGHYGLATVAFALALLSKPSAVTLPLVAWVLDGWVLRRAPLCSAKPLGRWLALSLLFVGVAYAVQPASESRALVPLWARPLVAGDALGFYISKLALPWNLAPDYGRSPDWLVRHAWSQPLWIAPVALAAWLWWKGARWPWLVAASAVSVCSVLPVLGLAPFRFQGYSTVADRYFYVAMLGPALALACALARLSPARMHDAARAATRVATRVATRAVAQAESSPTPRSAATRSAAVVPCALVVCALIALGAFSMAQTARWRDTSTLFEHTLRVNARSYLAHTILGNQRNNAGDTARAQAHYRRAIKAKPSYAMAHNNLGLLLLGQGKEEAALSEYREALRHQKFYPDAHVNAGLVLLRQGKLAAAETEFREALQSAPNSAKAYLNLGVVAEKRGRLDEATAFYREALRFDPNLAEAHYDLGNVLADQQKPREALAHWREALRLAPNYVEAHFNAGLVLSAQGDVAGARAHWREALRLKQDFAMARQALQRFPEQ